MKPLIVEAKPQQISIDPARAAVVVVDMQNDFVRQGGMIYVKDAIGTVPFIQKLITWFRQRKRPVIYTKAISSEDRLKAVASDTWPDSR